jgi:hypothetical protein
VTKRITVTIQRDGSISAESSGRAGAACLDDMAMIEALCDSAFVVGSNLTPEYFSTSQVVQTSRTFDVVTEGDSA